ncbi:MAG: hypothetical protein MZW92_03740 [Comamonadaceae bacterium]|nr:hypothetical protein [Comamonadaceae bacterium]
MSCLLAKRLGARRVLALINRRAYADLVQGTADRHRDLARRRPSSASCWPTCGAATSRPCTACAAAPPRRWRRSCAATARPASMAGRRIDEIGAARGRADRRHRARPAPRRRQRGRATRTAAGASSPTTTP